MPNGFDEAWLQAYQGRMNGYKLVAPLSTPAVITLTLAKPTLLLNQVLRMHWAKQREYKRALSAEIARQLPGDPFRQPFERASVLIRRMSAGVADYDNLVGGVKFAVDCLLVRSERHPWGMGLIRDDGPAHMTLTVEAEKVPRAEQRTIIRIERMG